MCVCVPVPMCCGCWQTAWGSHPVHPPPSPRPGLTQATTHTDSPTGKFLTLISAEYTARFFTNKHKHSSPG